MIGLTLVNNNATNTIGNYLYGSIQPQISFFKYVMRRNTNFFITNHTMINITTGIQDLEKYNESIKLQDYISGDIDLLSNLYISFYLPEIYSNDKYKFKWVDNIAALLIKNISFEIDGQEIDSFTGEWLYVWNELSSSIKDNFNKMSGNSIEITNPQTIEKIIRIKNNIISDFDYPSSDINNSSPSIPSKWVTVQLPFWFTKSPNLALPIFGNIYNNNNMYINYTLENIEKLYTIYSDVYNMNISPQHYNTLHAETINITNFTKDIKPNIGIKMIATVITLDYTEKNLLAESANKTEITYMIESIRKQEDIFQAGSTGIRNIDVSRKSLIKELVWTLKRNDSINNFNDTLNYSYNIPFNNEKSIMKNAYINWGKNSLLSEQESFYFNKIQPYQYHNTIPKQGIYLYSFSLLPDKSIHSGSYNSAGNTEIININMTFNNYEPSVLDYMYEKKYKKKYNSHYTVDLISTLYIVEHKFIIIKTNQIKLKYSD